MSTELLRRLVEAAQTSSNDAVKILEQLSPDDINLSGVPAHLVPEDAVGYVPVLKSEAISIGLFVLPPKGCIPLHDHPNMTVLTKVLQGSIEVTSFDFVDRISGLARPFFQGTLKTNAIDILTPRKGNVHELATADGAIFIDVIFPPYNSERPCTYYEWIAPDDYNTPGVLKTVDTDFYTILLPYSGPLL